MKRAFKSARCIRQSKEVKHGTTHFGDWRQRRTGQLIVQKLIQLKCAVRVLTRNPKQAEASLDANVEIMAGDITQRQAVEAAMRTIDELCAHRRWLVYAVGFGDFVRIEPI